MTIVNTQTGEIGESLTAMERSALTHAEATIEQGLETFIEVGNALASIRDGQLYRVDFLTFGDYCADRWNISRARAYQLINAADVSTNVDIENEGQARALSGLPAERQVEVFEEAKTRFATERPTGAQLRAAREPIPEPTEVHEQKSLRDLTPSDFVSDASPESAKVRSFPEPKPRPFLTDSAADYDNAEKAAMALSRAIAKLLEFQHPNMREGMRRYWSMASKEVPPTPRRDVTPEQMRVAAQGLLALADEWSQQ